MLPFEHDTLPSITIEHIPDDGLTAASFDWAVAQPADTYTIDATPHLSLELDKHFPVRPAKIILTDCTDAQSIIALERYAGEVLAAAMQQAPLVGFCVVKLALTPDNRAAIAALQIASPSSPALLKRACQAIIALGVKLPKNKI